MTPAVNQLIPTVCTIFSTVNRRSALLGNVGPFLAVWGTDELLSIFTHYGMVMIEVFTVFELKPSLIISHLSMRVVKNDAWRIMSRYGSARVQCQGFEGIIWTGYQMAILWDDFPFALKRTIGPRTSNEGSPEIELFHTCVTAICPPKRCVSVWLDESDLSQWLIEFNLLLAKWPQSASHLSRLHLTCENLHTRGLILNPTQQKQNNIEL